ncbi:MAG: BtrH N-terminal domain-containing protein [Bacteroidia bacterium]|nr:BtrH N-terminal domain-containing protein [Bacteroidia bacterium]
MMIENFTHIQSAHCENGVITKLLRLAGHEYMTEPLAFGMGSGLFYIHVPYMVFNGGPAISFRTMPGAIFKRTCNSLKIEVSSKKFRNEQKAEEYLDTLISQNIVPGCQVGVFNLSYFPPEYRFHFNAHNLIVYGKKDDTYLISDPVMEKVTSLSAEELSRARFAKGMLSPNGHLYYITKTRPISEELIRRGIAKGIKRNIRDMLHIPGNFGGVSGILYTSAKIRTWRDKLGVRKAGQYLGQIIRMQEEIGTGGGGFRFIYAAFLEEAAKYCNIDALLKISDEFTKSGDLWRQNAVNMAGVLRGRSTGQQDFDHIADVMIEIHQIEKNAFIELSKIKFK